MANGTATFVSPFALSNLTAPASGITQAAKWTIGLSNNTATLPLSSQVQQLGVFLAQAITIDNTSGNAPIVFKELTTGYTRTINAGIGMTFQFPAVEYPILSFSSAGTLSFPIFVYDWPAFPDTWTNNALASGAVTITGTVPVTLATAPAAAPITYQAPASTTIAAGGTSQTLFSAGQITYQGVVSNPGNATESLFVNPVGAAATAAGGNTFEIVPGGSFTFGPATGAITVNAVTTGHVFSAYFT